MEIQFKHIFCAMTSMAHDLTNYLEQIQATDANGSPRISSTYLS